jgi:hypothetical protein
MDRGRLLHFQFPAVQVALNEMAEDCMLTTGIDSKNSKISHLSGESGGIGYQSILDALPTPSDDGFLGCHQSQAERHEFSGDASVLTGSAEAAFSCGIWAFSIRRFDELIIGANVGLTETVNEINHEYASPCISDRR